jgi:hypothetical protein
MIAGSTKLIWSWSQRTRSASPTERNYPNAEIVMHENEPAYWFDDEKCKGHQPGAEMFFQAGTECDFTLNSAADPYTWRAITLKRMTK